MNASDARPSGEPAHAEWVDAFVALGSNLEPRQAHVEYALQALAHLPQTLLVTCSRIIQTEPVGPPGQGPYLNGVVHLRTGLPPAVLLARLLEIEQARGRDRRREVRFGARTLDLDLLLYGNRQIDEPGLRVPHPRMAEREFVMGPLEEIAPAVAASVRSGVYTGLS